MSSPMHIRKSDQSLVTFPTNIVARSALPYATPTDDHSEGLHMGGCSTHLQGEFYGPQGLFRATISIDKLTDDALLEIFDFHLNSNQFLPRTNTADDEWHTLVHVCQRWRNIVFASPHRLNLRLLCTNNRPVRAMLDIWPVLPLAIEYNWANAWQGQDADNIIAALEHHDRVREISLPGVPNPVWETLAATMQVPFPELTSLFLCSKDRSVPVLPDSFLGGFTPRLRTLVLRGIPFPAVRNLLLSASDLVHLELWGLPHSGYISPESMVACLSSLNRLKSLWLGFESPRSCPDQPSPPPQTRVVLPALGYLNFKGMTDYSEDFLARIDTPVLKGLRMTFFMDLVFDIPHLKQFISHAKGLNPSKATKLLVYSRFIRLELNEPHGLSLEVRCNRIDWQLDSMARVCGQLSSFFSSTERFSLVGDLADIHKEWKDYMESTQLLEILQSFTAIQSLYVSTPFLPFIAPALKELIEESVTEMLPNLRDLSLEKSTLSRSIQQDIQPFTEARRLSNRPVAIHHPRRR